MTRRIGLFSVVAVISALVIVISGCATSSTSPSPAADPGEVFGYVLNALTGLPIEGAAVTVDGVGTLTSETGYYIVQNVDPGTVNVVAAISAFVTVSTTVQVDEGGSTRQDCVLIPTTEGDEYRIVLTWGSDPADLDSHVWVPIDEGITAHVYFGYRGSSTSEPYAELDVDDVTGYGPETITVFPEHAGTYTYSVYHFSGTGTLQSSDAVVRIYQGNNLRYTLTAPDEPCSANWWWNVCTFNAQAGTFTISNTLGAYSPFGGEPMAK